MTRFSITERTFTPKEAAEISGVSPVLQRNWRRRGFLPVRNDGWAQFTVSDIVRLCAMKILADTGISIEAARQIAATACDPVYAMLRGDRALLKIDDPSGVLSPAQREKALDRMLPFQRRFADAADDQSPPRYTFAPVPEVFLSEEHGMYRAPQTHDLRTIDEFLERHDRASGVIIDHHRLAERIARVSPIPLFTLTVSED